ncbi:MAG: dTDP-4-dehydrorhamnose 3,5-epimerase [Gemmatimonadales bacterium]|nr:dTDP-4-dehydrorhamnose 3,5-epimerase [Gemmatimonadales bacterium]
MIIQPTPLAGAYTVALERREDERGFFARAFCRDEFTAAGIEPDLAQANLSYNRLKGTLRGLHYQVPPYRETKLVRCVAGSLFDVIVDVRPESPTYREWFGVELSAANQLAVFVPRGFAHGLVTLQDDTSVFYMASEFYAPDSEAGLRWDDPRIGIDWPIEPTVISEKDRAWPDHVG